MASGNFYGRGATFTSGSGSNGGDGSDGGFASSIYSTPRSHLVQPPSHELARLNQKLDRMFAVITEQKSAIEKGKLRMLLVNLNCYAIEFHCFLGIQESAYLKQQVETLGENMSEVRASMKRL